MHNIEFIVFDLDGTLLDSVPDLAIAADKAAQKLGYPAVSEEQVRDYVGNGADVLIGRALSQSLTVDPNLPQQLRTEARQLFDQFYTETHHQLSHLYHDVTQTLERIKQLGIPMAIVTNKPSKFVPEILEQHGIADYFVEVLGGDAFDKKKPDPIALQFLADKFKVKASEMLMVGDSKNDILAAKNAGCISYGLTYGYNHGEPIANAGPDYVADSVKDIIQLVS